MAETFEQIEKPKPSHKLSVYDWVSQKAIEYSSQAHKYIEGKSKTELAVEGAALAVGVAGSILLHRNLIKPGSGAEAVKATESEVKAVFGGVQQAAPEAVHEVKFQMPPPPPTLFESAHSLRGKIEGKHFELPPGMSVEDIPKKPPMQMPIDQLPYPGSKNFNEQVADSSQHQTGPATPQLNWNFARALSQRRKATGNGATSRPQSISIR